MNFLDIVGLRIFLIQLKTIFGKQADLVEIAAVRRKNLLEINYEKELAFDTSFIVGDNGPYVGYAVVGSTYVA